MKKNNMHNKTNKVITAMKQSRLTPDEKTRMWMRVDAFVKNHPIHITSPYFSKHSFSLFGKVALAGVMVAILSVSGLTYASASALPGDFLYPVKINVKEKMEDALVFTSDAKIAQGKKRVDKRISEVKTLAKQKKLTPARAAVAKTSIQKATDNVSKEIAAADKEPEEKEAIDATLSQAKAAIALIEEPVETADSEKFEEKLEAKTADIEMAELEADLEKAKITDDESFLEFEPAASTDTAAPADEVNAGTGEEKKTEAAKPEEQASSATPATSAAVINAVSTSDSGTESADR